ncbi:CLUMA_CG005545, isoform A [Clunio marinus]|uniref:CLUMA_CG005545, isoform A n=1 Tax=Clunio marinus TaxID=568069 RepID=A0A1J1HV24_9DIPT|nr:CLUMA_CG005545, isoform A [Clunio marinus]
MDRNSASSYNQFGIKRMRIYVPKTKTTDKTNESFPSGSSEEEPYDWFGMQSFDSVRSEEESYDSNEVESLDGDMLEELSFDWNEVQSLGNDSLEEQSFDRNGMESSDSAISEEESFDQNEMEAIDSDISEESSDQDGMESIDSDNSEEQTFDWIGMDIDDTAVEFAILFYENVGTYYGNILEEHKIWQLHEFKRKFRSAVEVKHILLTDIIALSIKNYSYNPELFVDFVEILLENEPDSDIPTLTIPQLKSTIAMLLQSLDLRRQAKKGFLVPFLASAMHRDIIKFEDIEHLTESLNDDIIRHFDYMDVIEEEIIFMKEIFQNPELSSTIANALPL